MRALSVELTPSTQSVKPFEPLDLRVRIRNTSRLPLAIGADAPVSGVVSLRTSAPRAGAGRVGDLPPQPVLIDRRLRLEPGDELDITIETALTQLGLLLAFKPLDSHLVNVAVVTNPAAASSGVAPGFMGTVTEARPIQYSGVVVTEQWVTESLALTKSAGRVEGVVRLALLIHAAADPERFPEAAKAPLRGSWDQIVSAWKAMPPRAQAWVLAVLPQETPAMAPLLEAARASTDPDVLRSWLITRISDPKDALLDVARRSADPELVQLADSAGWMLSRRAARAVEEVGVEAERAKQGAAPVPQGGGR